MRIERTGKIEALTPRVGRFIQDALGGLSLDDLQASTDLRADYICLRGLLAIELKSLEDDGEERMENLLDGLRKRPDWPMFLGSVPMESFIKNTDDPESVAEAVRERISRGVINPLKKANRQLEAHAASFPRRSQVRILIIVNEDHEIYDPHTVSYILWHAVRRKAEGRLRYEHIDAVIYLTERHASVIAGRVTFPIVLIESPAMFDQQWKSDVLGLVTSRWGRLDRRDFVDGSDDISKFSTIDHIPQTAPRHERWRTEYRRNPYLNTLTKAQLRDRFDEVMLLIDLAMMKDSPVEFSLDEQRPHFEQFTHLTLEMGDRAIPATEFDHNLERAIAAAGRLKLGPQVIEWIVTQEREAEARRRPTP